jgi:elongation factor P
MADVTSLRKGNIFLEGDVLWRVMEFHHIKMARGGATIRLKVRNVRTGSLVEKTFNNGARVEDVRLEGRTMEYLYPEGDQYVFMDTNTYDQVSLTQEILGEALNYLSDNQTLEVEFYGEEALGVTLPTTVDLQVTWAEMAVAGDTANNPTKAVELESGLKLQVPMFVKEGDTIRVDTRDGRYVTRV